MNHTYRWVIGVLGTVLLTGMASWLAFGGGVSVAALRVSQESQDERWAERISSHEGVRVHDGAVSSKEFTLVRDELANLREDMRAQAAKLDQIILWIGQRGNGGG